MVKAILPFCASSKTSIHNHVFLEGVKAALITDKSWNNGNYKKQPVAGLKSFGRVYAGWAFSQDFYRKKLYKKFGFNDVEDLLKDWAEIGLITTSVLDESLIVRRYEQAILNDATIKGALEKMAAELCVEMSIEDAIFNGLRGVQ
jgi:homoserine acetyltransferase